MGKKDLGPPPLGLLTVAALLPDDWDLRLVDMNVRDVSEEDWNYSDLLLLTGMSVSFSKLVQIVQEGKQRGKTIVLGGPLVFHGPEEALKFGVDIAVKGEAELAVPMLLEALKKGRSGIVIDPKGKPDLRDSPPPRYDLVDINQYLMMGVQFSRGCPFMCEFCDITLMYGRQVRTKSPEQILRELENLYDLGWRRYIFFVDDNLIGNPPRAKALLREMIPWMEARRYPFDFITYTSINLAADDELLDLIVRAGFIRVVIGVETLDHEALAGAKKYQNIKIDIDKALDKINRAGLQILLTFIVGLDNEHPGVDDRLIDFAARTRVPEIYIMLLQVVPGSDLWKRLEKEGRLLWRGIDDSIGSRSGLINFVPTRPITEIVQEYCRLHDVLYDPDFYLQRVLDHFSRMKKPPPKKRFAAMTLSEIRILPSYLVRHARIYSSPWNFFKSLVLALFRFPRRLRDFLLTCAAAEHIGDYRNVIKEQITARLNQDDRFSGDG
jgi:radical SAM superfamily enzyme YgiQ (UPF0313 family)